MKPETTQKEIEEIKKRLPHHSDIAILALDLSKKKFMSYSNQKIFIEAFEQGAFYVLNNIK
jgi:hypothetical protein